MKVTDTVRAIALYRVFREQPAWNIADGIDKTVLRDAWIPVTGLRAGDLDLALRVLVANNEGHVTRDASGSTMVSLTTAGTYRLRAGFGCGHGLSDTIYATWTLMRARRRSRCAPPAQRPEMPRRRCVDRLSRFTA